MANRPFFAFAAAITFLATATNLHAVSLNEIITEEAANRVGLTRSWITQVQLDRGKARVRDIVLYEGILYVQTSGGSIEAIDAETGQMLWSKLVGSANHPGLTPCAFRDLLATINGSHLIVLNRYTGDVLWQTIIDGAAGGGPALSSKRVYVPMVTGMIKAYRIEPLTDPSKELGKAKPDENQTEDEKLAAIKAAEKDREENIRINQEYLPPLACQSSGRAVAPLPTFCSNEEEFVSWTTDRGYLHVGYIDRRTEDTFVIKYRLETGGPISARPAYLPPDPKVLGDSGTVFAGSEDGYIYALMERSGEILWKFSAAEPVIDSPVIVENRIFATTQLGGLFCLDIKTGKLVWNSPQIVHFLAAGKERVYGTDKLGRLRILDGRNGSVLDSMGTETLPIVVANGRTDRIYLGTEMGTLQCLHETELTKPIVYNEARWKVMFDEEQNKPAVKPSAKLAGDGASHAGKAAAPRAAAKVPSKAKDKDKAAGAFDDPAADAPPAKDKPANKGKKGKPADAAGDPFG